jgi:hypothetical protein
MCAFDYMLPPSNASSSIMAIIHKKLKLKTCAQICSVFGGMLIEHKNPWSISKNEKSMAHLLVFHFPKCHVLLFFFKTPCLVSHEINNNNNLKK